VFEFTPFHTVEEPEIIMVSVALFFVCWFAGIFIFGIADKFVKGILAFFFDDGIKQEV